MTPKLFREDETRQWLLCAQEDLSAVEALVSVYPPLVRGALFHCQQAAEKAMKAFLVWHDEPFTKTHNLTALGDQCVGIDQTLEGPIGESIKLTRFAIRFRYPGEPERPTVEEARHWLAAARSVFAAILDRLPEQVRR